jgi:RHS repeat-associated protein
VRQLVDPAGGVTLARSYAPFGSTLSSAGSGTTAFAFTGEQADTTGLVYLRARYMSPSQGRFISRDTWGGDAYVALTLNLWLYANANPLNARDPSGHCVEEDLDGRCDEVYPPPGQSTNPLPLQLCSSANSLGGECIPWRCPVQVQSELKEYVGEYVISMYYHADDKYFSGDHMDVRGLPGRKAHWQFLFGRAGVAMQGSGYLMNGELIEVTNPGMLDWVTATGDPAPRGLEDHLGDPEAAIFGLSRKALRPYVTIATSTRDRLAAGDRVYMPTMINLLANHGVSGHSGRFQVMDHGGGLEPNRQLDLFVGRQDRQSINLTNSWFGDPRHERVPVYRLLPRWSMP